MNIKAGLCGALLLLATATAYGLGAQSGQAQSPAPASSTPAIPDAAMAQLGARARAFVTGLEVDPDSENGRILVQWLIKIALVPEFSANLSTLDASPNPLGSVTFSSENRLKMLRSMKVVASESRDDCKIKQPGRDDLGGLAKTLSPKGLRSALEMIEVILTQRSGQAGVEEHYTVAELLDADARLNSVALPESLSKGHESDNCALFAFLIDAVVALPEPQRRRATYEFFKRIGGGKQASESVLGDPAAYLDDVFDERRLPDSIRRRLPPDGSRPLPFSRLIVDAEWVNKSAPEAAFLITDTYVNRRNNGVVAELVTSQDKSGKTTWSDFTLSFGIADMFYQSVGSDTTMLRTLKDDTAIAIANQPMVKGKRIEIPIPQPSRKGELSRRCEVGMTVPASTIFHTLTGDAVDLACSEIGKDGTTTRVRATWLSDYGVTLSRAFDGEEGRTDVVIKNVTIVKP
ncbi:hypothetical protein [Burkholderia ubonensis]|uniref:Uncharacterized protein n=1 Tax=Burkholderia ubonensis subsp. mesacidophila TaxID=265293 RepID=A0A2A4FLL8_9BURK|nr:hypothetical protein [Burkholderia ubonensis]PCE34005.1 hypothetical protein BZL54_02330 [Burkholderia ubonensis subsp. mesacidophila]